MVPPSWLGDTVIYQSIAESLADNGFIVTYFSSLLSSIDSWTSKFNIVALPPLEALESTLDQFDIALVDRATLHGFYKLSISQASELAQKYIISAAHVLPPELKVDITEHIETRLPAEKADKVKSLLGGNSEVTFSDNKEITVLDHAVLYCSEKLKLDNVSSTITLNPPRHLVKSRHPKRIILCPYSSDTKKDWSIKSFEKLALRLEHNGFEPVFSVLPSDIERLPDSIKQNYLVPVTKSLEELVSLIYESRALIAVDTGSGHLASLTGIPTITIYRKQGNKFRWRPAWGENRIIRPKFQLKFKKHRIWSPFVSTRAVFRELLSLIDK
ncbi:hypothetical protein R50073_01780 [Maricurvus nonylphenolicus]